MVDIEALFEKYDDEFLEWDRVEVKLHRRADMHAFLLLDQLVPGDRDIISDAEHDQIWLDIDSGALAEVVTEDQVRDLHRCGVRCEDGCLCMFV